MLERGLVPLHLKESSDRVVELVHVLHRVSIHSVRLLHVDGSPRASRESARRLGDTAAQVQQALERSGSTISVDSHTRTGGASDEIVNAAAAMDADLIALPWKRKTWVQRSLLGSTSLDVIRVSDRPVLIQKRPVPADDEPLSVLYATDLAVSDAVAFPLIEAQAIGRIDLTILNVDQRAPDPVAERRRQEAVSKALESLRDRATSAVESVELVQRIGSSRRLIPRFLKRNTFDLVVIGKSSASGSVLGSVAEEVAYASPCSVLIVPPRDGEGDSHA